MGKKQNEMAVKDNVLKTGLKRYLNKMSLKSKYKQQLRRDYHFVFVCM